MQIHFKEFPAIVKRGVMVSACAFPLLFGCIPIDPPTTDVQLPSTPLKLEESHKKQALWQALEMMRVGELAQGNVMLNQALSNDPADANMHFLNAYIYEKRSKKEGLKVADLAPAGYQAALNVNPLHWPAAYRLGLWYINQHKYEQARAVLGEAALIKEDSPEIFNALAIASYHAHDLDAAKAFLKKSVELTGDTEENVRARAIVYAALNNKDDSSKFLKLYDGFASDQEVNRLQSRIRQWGGFHADFKENGPRQDGSKLLQKA